MMRRSTAAVAATMWCMGLAAAACGGKQASTPADGAPSTAAAAGDDAAEVAADDAAATAPGDDGVASGAMDGSAAAEPGATEVKGLKTPAAFADISDAPARSVALFEEAGKVILHPRCTNCHPAGDSPTQQDDMRPHVPPVFRGTDNHGVVGMRCATCHQAANVELGDRSVPGDPAWHLAPLEMAWQGKSLAEICAQLKDPARNGERDLAAIVEHSTHDGLVGWGWNPGTGRAPAPGDQATFGALIAAWVETGAHCPE